MEDRPERNEQEARVEPDEGPERDIGEPEEEPKHEGIGATFRDAYRRVKEGQQRTAAHRPRGNRLVSERTAQNRDRTKAMFVMVAGVVILLVVFLGLFSSSHGDSQRAQSARRGNPSLGRPGNPALAEGERPGSVTPLLSAELSGQEAPNDQLTPEDIIGTAHPKAPGESASVAPGTKGRPSPRALSNVPFSDPALEAYRRQLQSPAPDPPPATGSYTMPQAATAPQSATVTSESEALAKSSLVYVRTTGMSSAGSASGAAAVSVPGTEPAFLDQREWGGLPPGTRLVARLQTAVSTAVKAPVVAVIETHYERDGEIVVPAGTKAFGELQNASRSGFVGIRFHTVQMPDGATQKIDAGAMSLTFGPLKGQVTGSEPRQAVSGTHADGRGHSGGICGGPARWILADRADGQYDSAAGTRGAERRHGGRTGAHEPGLQPGHRGDGAGEHPVFPRVAAGCGRGRLEGRRAGR